MSYWADTRAPRYSIIFAVPLLLLYEGLAWAMGRTGVSQVRNGADVLLKNLFVGLGGRYGLTVFAAVLLLVGLYLVGRDVRKNGAPVARTFVGMAGESILYAVLLGIVAAALTSMLLTGRLAMVQGGPAESFPLPVQLMVSLGAGLYEELVFRVLLVSGLAAIGAKVFGWKRVPAGIAAAVLGALIFSAFHYIGPYGDPFQVGSFTFRAIAGLLFSTLVPDARISGSRPGVTHCMTCFSHCRRRGSRRIAMGFTSLKKVSLALLLAFSAHRGVAQQVATERADAAARFRTTALGNLVFAEIFVPEPPTVFSADGRQHLSHELFITNASGTPWGISRIQIVAGDRVLLDATGEALRGALTHWPRSDESAGSDVTQLPVGARALYLRVG